MTQRKADVFSCDRCNKREEFPIGETPMNTIERWATIAATRPKAKSHNQRVFVHAMIGEMVTANMTLDLCPACTDDLASWWTAHTRAGTLKVAG